MTGDNRFIIDVNVPDPEEIFEKYDTYAFFYKKDLNERLEQYLVECVEEIGLKNKFIIRIGLPENQLNKFDEGDTLISFKQYFTYCIHTCQKEIKTIISRMAYHLGFALPALSLMMVFEIPGPGPGAGFFNRMALGLPAAVWVLLLSGFSRFFFRFRTQRSHIKLYEALRAVHIEFRYNREKAG